MTREIPRSRPVTAEQNRRFGLAVCKRLGLDPALVMQTFTWSVVTGEELGEVNFTVRLPAQEVLDLWDGATPAEPAAVDDRRAPVNGQPYGTISWSEHVEAWEAYHRCHREQDAETIAKRGGFGLEELTYQLGRLPSTWQPSDATRSGIRRYAR